MAATFSFNAKLTPQAAVEFFRKKKLKASFAWQDVWNDEHDASFVVAKMMDLDLLRDVRDAVDAAIAEGKTFRDFQKELQPLLVQRGWWGQQEMIDPDTGEVKTVQLGSVRRLQTIYRTNMQTAFAAGDYQRAQETKAAAPYLMYDAIDDNRTRPQHRAWDGTILPMDDDWWSSHTPPCGYNCRCSTIQLSSRDVKGMGRTVDDAPPPGRMREYVNPRSGEISQIPEGVDPGFGYIKGATSSRDQAMQWFNDKVAGLPADMQAAARASLESRGANNG